MRIVEGRVVTGGCGKGIEVDVIEPEIRDWEATVALWFFDCPSQSPAWHNYMLGAVHLRPIEGVKPPVINVPGATHEVLLAALDPRREPTSDVRTWELLHPLNVCEQVELPDDEAARELLFKCAMAVVVGVLPAEPMLSGAREWRTALIKTAAHLRGEEHAP